MKLATRAKVASKLLNFEYAFTNQRNLFTATNKLPSNINSLLSPCLSKRSTQFVNSTSNSANSHFANTSRLSTSSLLRDIAKDFVQEDSSISQNDDTVSWVTKRANDGRDRSRKIPVELSMAYLDSAAYKATYGDYKVWEQYRRNYAGRLIGSRTRKSCVVEGRIETGNPCPICRDEYLVVDYRNVKLLRQFLTDYNGMVLDWKTTHVCREQYKNLMVAIEKARDYGYLDVDAHFVEYDYSKYMPKNF